MDERAKRVVSLGYEFAKEAMPFLERAIPKSERHALDMAVFSGSAAAALLATAYRNVRKIKGDAKEARNWLAGILRGATEHIADDFGDQVKILLVERAIE